MTKKKGTKMQEENNNDLKKTDKKQKTVKNRKLQIFLTLLMLIFVGVFIYVSIRLIIWIRNDIETKKLENQMQLEILTEQSKEEQNQENNENDEKAEPEVDFAKLEEINSDVIGWIKIKDTYIDYPILYSDTYGYYVERDINKKYNAAGSIFVDPGTNKEFKGANTVLWGHHMRNGKMFANLNKIYKGELGENIEIRIITKEETYTYKIFATYVMDLDNATIKQNLSDKEKETYIERALKRSKIKFNTENMDRTKEMLTLVTCTADGEQRIVVNAIKQ